MRPGDVVQARRVIKELGDDDSPDFVFARGGELLEIVSLDTEKEYPFEVKVPGGKYTFCVKLDEIEPARAAGEGENERARDPQGH